MGDNKAFSQIQVSRKAGFDKFDKTSIEYIVNDRSICYKRTENRWMPTVKNGKCNLQEMFDFSTTCYISTSGIRFYQTEPKSLEQKRGKIQFQPASGNIKAGLNKIFDTQRFANLEYATIKSKRGRQQQLHRNNKLYSIKEGAERYSEINFSLGERLILNVLDYIEGLPRKSLMIIDEIELALHPVAQIEFYKYIKQLASDKQLTCIISTHSASLIKAAENLIYLENRNGEVTALTNCHPAYILKDITVVEDNRKDYLFFVEDKMAAKYLSRVIALYQQSEDRFVTFSIIPVGPYERVVEMMLQFKNTPPYKERQVQAFVDKDVEETIQSIRDKAANRTKADQAKLDLFNKEKEHITYLSITPEEGVWNWLANHTSNYEDAINSHYGQGVLNERMSVIKGYVDEDEKGKGGDNKRSHAKGCFKNILERLHQQVHNACEEELLDLLFETYVKDIYDNKDGLNKLKSVFKTIINRPLR